MPRHTTPIHNGTVIPAGSDLGPITFTLKGPSSITITDPTGSIVFEGDILQANPSESATVTWSPSLNDSTPADYTVTISGNVQGQIVTSTKG